MQGNTKKTDQNHNWADSFNLKFKVWNVNDGCQIDEQFTNQNHFHLLVKITQLISYQKLTESVKWLVGAIALFLKYEETVLSPSY